MTTNNLVDFINTQIILPILIVGALIVIILFIAHKPSKALGTAGGLIVGLAVLAGVTNWQRIGQFFAHLVGLA